MVEKKNGAWTVLELRIHVLERFEKMEICLDKFLDLVERHILFIKLTLFVLIFFFIYTYDRSFRVHQETEGRILRWNNREGIFCSKVHVGHDGTTLEFVTIPPEVGTAGTIDSSSLSNNPLDPFERISLIPIHLGDLFTNSSFFLLLSLSLFLLLLFLYVFAKLINKIKKRKEGKNQHERTSNRKFMKIKKKA